MTMRQSTTSRFLSDRGLESLMAHQPGPARDELSLQIARIDPDSDVKWVGRLRRIGAAKLQDWGLATITDDAQLLISELVTNALRYGNADIVVYFAFMTSTFLIAVYDGSPHRPELTKAGSDSEGGRGLVLVAEYATAWGVSADGTTTWCTLTEPRKVRAS